MIEAATGQPLVIEPRIGGYKMQNQIFTYDLNGVPTIEIEELDIDEVDLSTDEKAAKLFTFYGPQIRGLYTPSDASRLMLSQTGAEQTYQPAFMFIPCQPSQGIIECASRDEIDDYLKKVRLYVGFVENFIELD